MSAAICTFVRRHSVWRGGPIAFVLSLAAAIIILPACRRAPTVAVHPESSQQENALNESAFKYRDYNLVFVSFDALQAAHVGSLGYPRKVTPTLDALAQRGFSFSHAYSVASWTVPASMTWFTGVYPSEHRMTNKFALYAPPAQKFANLKELSPNLVTLADVLRRNGYTTGGFTGNAGVSGGFGYDQGFDTYFFEKQRFGGFDESIPRAVQWLRANKDRKLFLFLHGYDCHGQNAPAGGYDYRFVDPNYDKRYTGSELEQEILREEGLDKGRLDLRDTDIRFWRAVYDEKIQRADAKFRLFLAEFEKLGLMDKTIFVVTSDHGTEFCEHGRFDHGFTLYNEQIHVPLIIKLPDQHTAKRISDHVSSIDVMPTILDLLDARVPADARRQLRGASLLPAMKGQPVRRNVYAETDYRLFTYQRAVISPDRWKLIYILEKKRRELYDLNADPSEQRNLADANPARADAMQAELFGYFKSIGHDLAARRWEVGYNPVYDFPTGKRPKE